MSGRSQRSIADLLEQRNGLSRRTFLGGASLATMGAALAGSDLAFPELFQAEAAGGLDLPAALSTGTRGAAVLDTLPGKKPLIKLAYRAPNYETPLQYFSTPITPNDAFFVRYHISDIPPMAELNAKTWKIKVGGDGANGEAEISLDDVKAMPAVEITAVNQCSGNRRGLFNPHVAGVQWGYGAMGCARWKGARLKDVLAKVGLKKEALEVVLDGADKAIVDKTPDFVKSVPLWKAVDENSILAYEMNGQPLPHLNGYPVRAIFPGWTGTYWMKQLTSLMVVTKPYEGFWMKAAYRVPVGKFPVVDRFLSQETAVNTPITEMVVNSLITSPAEGAKLPGGPAKISGIAWDGGYGIQTVEVSTDGGKTWSSATLGADMGRFAFRTWSHSAAGMKRGKHVIMARATNKIGQGQTTALILNPAGYHHNLVHTVTVNVA